AGLPGAALAGTIRHWNELVDQGDDTDFHRFDPPSSERPMKIEPPPFYAVQFVPLSRKSLGGVAVDLSCRVLDKDRKPIPGLYAVGELAGVGGINGRAALEGTMLGPSILMGRVAAKDIAGKIQRPLKPVPSRLEPEPAALAQSRATDPETLRVWRELLSQLVSQPRP